jgi:hypothetical protein
MTRIFALWTATALALSPGGLSASARDRDDAAAVPPVKGMRPKVSPDGRYFVDQNGTPAFWLGTTQWQLFREYKLADATTILEKTKEKGFVFAQVMLLGVGDGTQANTYGERPWVSVEPLTPNEAYFKNVDDALRVAGDNNVVISLTLYHQNWRKLMTEENARNWARWLAKRYKSVPNIVWCLTPEAKLEFIPVLRELAAGLREGDEGAHLITVEPDPAPYSSSFIHEEKWLDFDSIQTWKSVELIYPFVMKDYNLKPVKPVLMAEGAYEHGSEYGFDVTPLWVRRQAYYSYLVGAHHTYGHNDSWRVLPTWRQALDAPGAAQMGSLRKVFEARKEWWLLVPDQSIFVGGGNTSGTLLHLAARHKDGAWLMVYLGDKATFSIDRSRFTGASKASASWIDPRTGESVSLGEVPNRGVQQFATPEGWDDALLILEVPSREHGECGNPPASVEPITLCVCPDHRHPVNQRSRPSLSACHRGQNVGGTAKPLKTPSLAFRHAVQGKGGASNGSSARDERRIHRRDSGFRDCRPGMGRTTA